MRGEEGVEMAEAHAPAEQRIEGRMVVLAE